MRCTMQAGCLSVELTIAPSQRVAGLLHMAAAGDTPPASAIALAVAATADPGGSAAGNSSTVYSALAAVRAVSDSPSEGRRIRLNSCSFCTSTGTRMLPTRGSVRLPGLCANTPSNVAATAAIVSESRLVLREWLSTCVTHASQTFWIHALALCVQARRVYHT